MAYVFASFRGVVAIVFATAAKYVSRQVHPLRLHNGRIWAPDRHLSVSPTRHYRPSLGVASFISTLLRVAFPDKAWADADSCSV